MQWFREHPYASAITAVSVVLFLGAYLVKERATVSPISSTTIAWGGTGNGFWYPTLGEGIPADSTLGKSLADLYQQMRSTPSFSYIPYAPADTSGDMEDNFDLSTLLNQLSNGESVGSGNDATEDDPAFADAYSFIPRGLIATSVPESKQTPTQQALYQYGNDAGFYIKLFEERNLSMERILKDQFEDPRDPQKNSMLLALAEGMTEIGFSLEKLNKIPSMATSANTRLSDSYKKMGEKLALIPSAERDEERIAAILAYNAVVEEYVKSYVALATLFSIAEVKFGSTDPGSIFTFTVASF
ncbi:MAG: hypothetical protein UY57_C0023G0004 [Candidatus Kaiserbacteria bacterium GW2011_GWB1_50_17]|uniref:Uncharacterized protein n=2 Tax=Candidatus Kaiseribacteriota TaxID=1752734 RepID=A0A0G1WF09_9BACT|nr:MAG: hypothetical protein UY57_C0023G0004 [Candidatus Kaiserbacteria bacterium GW2011_GWB1_50_17]OGG88258.1 MAG: hypothetical protein A3H15_00850 [Candidatus Kaiserbacteria bacterium RIFCSPLOWO2_12_FULL_50_28]